MALVKLIFELVKRIGFLKLNLNVLSLILCSFEHKIYVFIYVFMYV